MCITLVNVLFAFLGCVDGGKEPDTAETASGPVCGASMDEFCEIEFGGPCPTFEEASALYCDGVHLTTMDTGSPADVYDANPECDNPRVICGSEVGRTILYYEADLSGVLEGVTLDWPDTDECPGYRAFGELWC